MRESFKIIKTAFEAELCKFDRKKTKTIKKITGGVTSKLSSNRSLSKFSTENTSQTMNQIVQLIANFIKKQSSTYKEEEVIKALQFLTHTDRISKSPSIENFQTKYVPDRSGLFALVSSAVLYQNIEKGAGEGDWDKTLVALKAHFSIEKTVAGRQILLAQIKLVELLIRFEKNTQANFGEEYKKILSYVPITTTLFMASMMPILSSFILINHIVQDTLYRNRMAGSGRLQSLHRMFLTLSALLDIPGKLAGLGLYYVNVYLADKVLGIVHNAYDTISSSFPLSRPSLAIVVYNYSNEANIDFSKIYKTQEFSLVAGILLQYINKKKNSRFPWLWTGTQKAKIMQGFLLKLSSIDRLNQDLHSKLTDALNLVENLLELNETISDSGHEAMEIVGLIKEFLSHKISELDESALLESAIEVDEHNPKTRPI